MCIRDRLIEHGVGAADNEGRLGPVLLSHHEGGRFLLRIDVFRLFFVHNPGGEKHAVEFGGLSQVLRGTHPALLGPELMNQHVLHLMVLAK